MCLRPHRMTKSIISSFPSAVLGSARASGKPGDWVTRRVSHSAVKSHLSWLGAYPTHLLEVSHFQHYILILVSGARQGKSSGRLFGTAGTSALRCKLFFRSVRILTQLKKKERKKEEASFYFAALYSLALLTLPALLSPRPSLPSAHFPVESCTNMVSVCVSLLCMKGTKMQTLTIRKTFSRESQRDRIAAF